MLGRLTDSTVQNCHHLRELAWPHGEGRHEGNHVTERSQEEAADTARLGHSMPDATLQRKGNFGLTILHQFNADHETALTDVTHMRQLSHWL